MTVYDCPRCFKPHPRGCHGHARHTSPDRAALRDDDGLTPCKRAPMRGQDVCAMHGGKSGQAKAAAAERIAEANAEALVTTYGLRVETTATEALLDEIQWTAGHVQWLRTKVQQIEADDLVFGETKRVHREHTDGYSNETTEAAELNVWLKLYQRERQHLVRTCAEAIRAGIEERKVRLAEQQGQLVADVIQRILDDLGLTAGQRELVSEVVPRHLLRLVS